MKQGKRQVSETTKPVKNTIHIRTEARIASKEDAMKHLEQVYKQFSGAAKYLADH